jgi:hypothetical protein
MRERNLGPLDFESGGFSEGAVHCTGARDLMRLNEAMLKADLVGC